MASYRLFTVCTISFLMLTDAAAQVASSESTTDEYESKSIMAQAASPAPAKLKQNSNTLARQKLYSTATSYIKNKQASQAYELLIPYESQLAGDPEYDYLLGMSALDSGKPNEAIFALERVLAVNPNHLQARAEIARAYLAAGEIETSKQEFETVLEHNPPEEVHANIQKYLDIIESVRSSQKTSIAAYIEAILGDDSNVNSATSSKQFALPLFGGALISLSDNGRANRDSFGSIGTGANIRHIINPAWSLQASANITKRNNATQLAFNTVNSDANAGVNYNHGNDNYTAVLQMQSFTLDNKVYRDAAGLTAQWQHNLLSGAQLSSYIQYSSLTYPDQTYRNADRYVIGGAYVTTLSGELAPVIYSGIYAGQEQVRETQMVALGNTLYGGRIGGELKLNEKLIFTLSASIEARTYGGTDSLFLIKRNDTQSDLKIGVNYLPTPKWTISPSLSYTNNNSNIIIDTYDRTVFSISARRDFN